MSLYNVINLISLCFHLLCFVWIFSYIYFVHYALVTKMSTRLTMISFRSPEWHVKNISSLKLPTTHCMNDMSWHVELGPSRSQSSCPLWSSCQNPQWTCCARVKLDWRHWTFSALSPNASGCSTESFIFSMAPMTPIRCTKWFTAEISLALLSWRCRQSQWPLSQGWEQDSVYHVLYISYHIVLLWVSGLLRNFSAASRHHPDTFFPRHGSHYHVSGLGDACCAACARKSSTAMNLWNATDTNFTQLHHNFVNLMHLQPVCSRCFSTAHLCSGVSLQRSMCWPSTAAPGLTDTLSPSLGIHVSHYGKSMKIRNKRSKCKTHQRYDLSESPIDFEAEQVFVTSARLKK